MTHKENMYEMFRGGKPEFLPASFTAENISDMASGLADHPWTDGMDAFGVEWVKTPEGVISKPGEYLFEDISEWRKYVHFPDVDSLGLEKAAEQELQMFEPDLFTVILSSTGPFERLVAFMGFENTLMALAEDPEECKAFFDAVADYKIAVHNRIIDLYHPDSIVMFDDIATARGLFMSPDTWRELLKPGLKRIVDAVRARGVCYGQHTCGKCESVIDDYVEIGVQLWHSAQCMNDLQGIMEKYKGKLIVEGGWDTSGPASFESAADEEIVEETKRCLREYGKYDNFIFFPSIVNSDEEESFRRIMLAIGVWEEEQAKA